MSQSNSARILTEWNTHHDALYHLRPQELEWNLHSQDLVSYEFKNLGGTLGLIAQATPIGISQGLPEKSLSLSLWGEVRSPALLVQSFVELARERGKVRLLFGADEFHFLAGIPAQDAALIEAAVSNGFQTSPVSDFTGNLETLAVTTYLAQGSKIAAENHLSLDLIKNNDDHKNLLSYLQNEFPGRWVREYQIWKNRRDTSKSWWMIFRQNKNDIVGFARLSQRGHDKPENSWTPGALKFSLSENHGWKDSDGSLGPIGVSRSHQGKGYGKALLALVLQALRQKSVDRICIDWTNAFKYYEPLGFAQSRNYLSSWRNVDK